MAHAAPPPPNVPQTPAEAEALFVVMLGRQCGLTSVEQAGVMASLHNRFDAQEHDYLPKDWVASLVARNAAVEGLVAHLWGRAWVMYSVANRYTVAVGRPCQALLDQEDATARHLQQVDLGDLLSRYGRGMRPQRCRARNHDAMCQEALGLWLDHKQLLIESYAARLDELKANVSTILS